MTEGRALQVLHVGRTMPLAPRISSWRRRPQRRRLRCIGPAHEVYLSDPRRVAPEAESRPS